MTKPRPALRAVAPSRNRTATPEEVHKALVEVDALLRAIDPLHMLPAADLIRAMKPSGEAIALLARRAIHLAELERQSSAGRRQRDRDALSRAVREILRAKPGAANAGVDQVIEELCQLPRTPFEREVSDDGIVTVNWFDKDGEEQSASRRNILKRIHRLRPKAR